MKVERLGPDVTYYPAETAADIVTLARVKRYLAIYFDDDDVLVQEALLSAIQATESYLGVPLIQRRRQWQVDRFDLLADDEPLVFTGNETAAILRVQYWTEDQSIREGPAGEILVSDLGRFAPGRKVEIYAGINGWPDRAPDSPAWIQTADQSNLAQNEGVKAGIIAYCRLIYNGVVVRQPNSVIRALLDPYRKLAEGVPFADISDRIGYQDLTGGDE